MKGRVAHGTFQKLGEGGTKFRPYLSQAYRAYSYGDGGRGQISNHQFSVTISLLPPLSKVHGDSCSYGLKTLRRIAVIGVCVQHNGKTYSDTCMLCPKEASFSFKWLKCGHSTIPSHCSIPVEHFTDLLPFQTSRFDLCGYFFSCRMIILASN